MKKFPNSVNCAEPAEELPKNQQLHSKESCGVAAPPGIYTFAHVFFLSLLYTFFRLDWIGVGNLLCSTQQAGKKVKSEKKEEYA